MEYKGMNQILHLTIAICLLFLVLFLYIGLRPIFLLASLALAIFLIDYSIVPFLFLYQAFIHWLPVLFELNLINGILILTQLLHFSKFWSSIFLLLAILRSFIIIFCRYLSFDHPYRLYIENRIQSLSNLFLQEAKRLYHRFLQLSTSSVDHDLDKYQLEQINSADVPPAHEHDDTIHRFQQIAQEYSSPHLSNLDCSNASTPPLRRHHQRILQQSELEPLSRTPITPAHSNVSKGKILHSTINGSYTGPMTRNRIRTGGSSSITTSPIKGKTSTEITFLPSKRNEEK